MCLIPNRIHLAVIKLRSLSNFITFACFVQLSEEDPTLPIIGIVSSHFIFYCLPLLYDHLQTKHLFSWRRQRRVRTESISFASPPQWQCWWIEKYRIVKKWAGTHLFGLCCCFGKMLQKFIGKNDRFCNLLQSLHCLIDFYTLQIKCNQHKSEQM